MKFTLCISKTYRLAIGNLATELKSSSTPPVPCLKAFGTIRVAVASDSCEALESMAVTVVETDGDRAGFTSEA
jgi:hypothetical protein